MSDALILTVSAEDKGARIDKFLSDKIERFSRSAAAKLIDDETVWVNGNIVSKNYKCKENDKISVIIPEAKPLETLPENIPLDFFYEDNYLLVVNKPK